MTSPFVSLEEMPGDTGQLFDQIRKKKFCLTGIFNRANALNYALASIPVYDPTEALFRQDVTQKHIGDDLYHFDVQYGPVPKTHGTYSINADSTGGSVHWNYSLECVAAYTPDNPGPSGDAAEKKPIVGERQNGVIEGTDRIIPVSKRTYTFNYDKGIVTEGFMDYLEILTGVVNLNPWHNRPGGEVLFAGFRCNTAMPPAACSISFDMLFSRNVSNATYGTTVGSPAFGQITGVDKKGHHFLDVIFEEENDGTAASQRLKMIRIHRLYEELDFATYLGF